jgi:hypothetical protein
MPPKCLVLNHSTNIALINCKLFATSERTVILEVYLEVLLTQKLAQFVL